MKSGKPAVEPDRLRRTIEIVQGFARELQVEHVLIGGVAVGILSAPRATGDVDFLMLDLDGRLPEVISVAEKHGLVSIALDPVALAMKTRVIVLKAHETGVQVDIGMGFIPLEREIVRHALEMRFGDVTLRVPRPEDLVIMKALAMRTVDKGDIERLLHANPSVNRRRVRKVIKALALALDVPGLIVELDQIFKATPP